MDEEFDLLAELKRIEMRKKEREKKAADLQKLISAAETQGGETKKADRKQSIVIPHHKKKHHGHVKRDSIVSLHLQLMFILLTSKSELSDKLSTLL